MSSVEGPDPAPREWALFAYICGDNPQIAAHARSQVEAILKFTGSAHLHLAAQWDFPEGAERGVFNESGTWEREPLRRVNTGDPETFLVFLRWAFDRCPSDHVIIVASGTGLLDQRASMGGPEHDRSHLFTICDDSSAGDALSLSEISGLLRKAVDASARDRIDILALDMRELQCLEVAYELEGIVEVLIAPQTRVPDSGWNFEMVLRECDAALSQPRATQPVSVRDMAKLLVRTVGGAYQSAHHGELSLSALDLDVLNPVASAFDTLSLAMVHSVGEELVWKARDAVAKRLKPLAVAPPAAVALGALSTSDARTEVDEIEYLYDLVELLREMRKELQETADSGLVLLLLEYLEPLDVTAFTRALQSIDDACFRSGSRLRFASLQNAIGDPRETRRRLRRVIKLARARAGAWGEGDATKRIELAEMFRQPSSSRAPENRSWVEDWPEETVAGLEPSLSAAYRTARRQQQRLRHLAALTDRVLNLLSGAAGDHRGQAQTQPLVLEHFVSAGGATKTRHGGVSLFRPRQLDQLIASDYLDLRFNQKIHWTVLLAVINLIGSHPRALWRILSAVLATADNSTRAQLIDRITGPGSVIAPFREQFVVLAPAKAFVLSLEPDPNATMSAPALARRTTEGVASGPQSYRVRLELAERDAFISEVTSIVDPEALRDVIDGLVTLMKSEQSVSPADVRRIESLGETLGEDILQDLGMTLSTGARTSSERIHLQLQIPRELMAYPWELMRHQSGWLGEDFALGRQVFSRSGRRSIGGRVPGPLRALVIGNPPTEGRQLPYAAREAEVIATLFEALTSETDGLIDFRRDEDARINQAVTQYELREMLRHGNYDIVHFAGHAAFDHQRPESSAWLLSDGPFSAQAIRNTLRWRESQPWLVFANACEAGMDGEVPTMYQTDVFGLASAFLDPGVSVFIGPLWRIDDTIAAKIALTFYQQLLKERQTVGEALRRAKADARRRDVDVTVPAGEASRAERIALASWAGLVLYGNSTATIGQRVGAPASTVPAGIDHDRGDI
jgi:hypothetical protein